MAGPPIAANAASKMPGAGLAEPTSSEMVERGDVSADRGAGQPAMLHRGQAVRDDGETIAIPQRSQHFRRTIQEIGHLRQVAEVRRAERLGIAGDPLSGEQQLEAPRLQCLRRELTPLQGLPTLLIDHPVGVLEVRRQRQVELGKGPRQRARLGPFEVEQRAVRIEEEPAVRCAHCS